MKKEILMTLFCAMLLIQSMSCAKREERSDNDTLNTDSVSTASAVDSAVSAYSDCVRGAAEPIFKREVFPTAIFSLDANKHTATELLTLTNGDKVIVRNTGCEYVVLTFRYETHRFQADTTDVNFWMEKALLLTGELANGLDDPLSISTSIAPALDSLKQRRGMLLGEEIVLNDSEIRKYVTLDRVQLIDGNKYGIELSFLLGPL